MTNYLSDTYSIQIINQPAELAIIVRCVELLAERWNWSKNMINKVNLSLEEVIANIIFHGFTDNEEHLIAVRFAKNKNEICIEIEDDGLAFNPLELDAGIDVSASVNEREVGGLGIHIVKNMMDKITYMRIGNKNRITLIKNEI